MMNSELDRIIGADNESKLNLYETAARRLGTTSQNAEKDFWVCWTLDALFNGLTKRPRLLFKGGTSLSKGFGLLQRFSEDIDITVFRDDLDLETPSSIEALGNLSGNQRKTTLKAVKDACETYINGPCLSGLSAIAAETVKRNGLGAGRLRVEASPEGEDRQTLYLHYPTATPGDSYVIKAVKIESGAKSALEPNSERIIRPYVEGDVPSADLGVAHVTTVDAERTFWDKIVILHGLRSWFDKRGELRGGGQRASRHYYDVCCLLASESGQNALKKRELGADCVAHARMFFNSPDSGLAAAASPTFSICPNEKMLDHLRRDYRAMSSMIFGEIPAFEKIIEDIAALEKALNTPTKGAKGHYSIFSGN